MISKKLILISLFMSLTSTQIFGVTSEAKRNNNIGKKINNNYINKINRETPKTLIIIEEKPMEVIVEKLIEKQVGKETVFLPEEVIEIRTQKIEKRIPKPFVPNGSIGLTGTAYGNSGKYKTAASHSAVGLEVNFAPKWTLTAEWDRLTNIYSGGYEGEENQSNNNYSSPQGQLSYYHGALFGTDIQMTTNIGAKQYNFFSDSTNQVYTWLNVEFDFYKYFPKYKYFEVTEFAIMPMYNYGFFPNSTSGHMNHMSLNLLSKYKLPHNWSLEIDAFFIKEFYNGEFKPNNENDAKYFGLYAWLEYSKELYKFSDKTNLEFNFATGFDPYVISNKEGENWQPPFWLTSNSYEWISPTKTSGSYNNMWTVFALPQLQINYKHSEALNISLFAQVKYSNQVWGNTEKDWELQPQGGIGITYNY